MSRCHNSLEAFSRRCTVTAPCVNFQLVVMLRRSNLDLAVLGVDSETQALVSQAWSSSGKHLLVARRLPQRVAHVTQFLVSVSPPPGVVLVTVTVRMVVLAV